MRRGGAPCQAAGCCLALALFVCLLAPQTASAQGIRRRAQPGVTALSNQIYADAVALRATGDFLVSAAIARNLNAEAASKEMDNAEKWVSTYFERRRLNREARAAENPGYLDRLEKQKETRRRIYDKGLPATGTDLSDDLNWMLREILANVSPSVFFFRWSAGVDQLRIQLAAVGRRSP